MNRRVVITGAGVVSSLGSDVDVFWSRCLSGASAVVPVPASWPYHSELHSRIWAPLPELDPESLGVARAERLQLDPVAMLALGAAREAIGRAGFSLVPAGERSRNFVLSGADSARTGVFFGTGLGGAITFLQNHTHHLFRKSRAALAAYTDEHKGMEDHTVLDGVIAQMTHGTRFNPFEVSMVMPNAPAAAIGIKYSLTGPNQTCCLACASGTVAVGNAFRAVRDGRVDVAVSGGCEYFADEHGHIFRSFDVSGTLVREFADPQTANRPFDEKRSGFLFSQGGAASLVLEELEHAQRRGAPIMAEVIGFSETFDAHSMMSLAPGGKQIERMIRSTLSDAGVSPDVVDYVNAHGTGTRNNDEIEAGVIERVFGKSVRVNSTKSILGHTIGASGAFEALVTALTLRDGKTHICKNLDTPLLDLNFVRRVERFDPQVGLTQSFAFGGHNAAVAMRRFS
ncbi:3-oxoacyl-ACP synthase [Sulfuricaulis limicola]|uniref:3-oxoacyl-ACP synthase n=1 Tax=Sulfuricaulis limicola TaxID=1620215 RepID=A0A1B4XG39_9GAMM|nr:beta-ketoacyl-[acyl-carrier-protein] synthase family protein [Sulfuricaulis limicola]BAV33782.1 3-oxoacyl-ACP synthase [Sulfuricaulis limicola]